MRKYVDYIREHELEEAKIEARCKEIMSPQTPERMQLLAEIIETDLNQYRIVKDEARRNRVENRHYPALCELARIQGGRVELDIDETYYYASIIYIGKELLIDGSYPLESAHFTQVIQDADTTIIEADGDYFQLRFTFEMNQKEFITDRTAELNDLKTEYKRLYRKKSS